jgi:hypothetical protein
MHDLDAEQLHEAHNYLPQETFQKKFMAMYCIELNHR